MVYVDGILKMPSIYIEIRFIGSDLKNLFRYSEGRLSRLITRCVEQCFIRADSFSPRIVLSFDIIVLMSRVLSFIGTALNPVTPSRKGEYDNFMKYFPNNLTTKR